jgi:hypothetical protein
MSKESLSNITEVAPGVYFRFGDIGRGQSNGGYIICDDYVVAIEAPSVESTAEMFDEVKKLTDKPIKFLVITHAHWDHDLGVDGFAEKGVIVLCHENARKRYAEAGKKGTFIGVTDRIALNNGKTIELFTSGIAHSTTDILTYLPDEGVVYTGDSVVSMPATLWMGESDIWNWIETLKKLKSLGLKSVCPGHGPVVGPENLDKLASHITTIRDEVGYQVSQGRSFEKTLETVKIATQKEWTPDDNQFKDHIKAVYDQLTSDPPAIKDSLTPHALILIGDHYHPPFYIPPSLEPVFNKIGMPFRFIYDVMKLNADNLKGVRLLVILRDGMTWPENDKDMVFWMTEDQEKAVDDFVKNGGGFLALHNCTALKRLDEIRSVYRDVLGSSYNGHGPGDEKFDVKVVNKKHPITDGVKDYVAVDERHTPIIHANDITVLTEAVNGDQKSVNGYIRTYGKGRICHLANGHNLEVLTNPEMQKLMVNGALWCIGLE